MLLTVLILFSEKEKIFLNFLAKNELYYLCRGIRTMDKLTEQYFKARINEIKEKHLLQEMANCRPSKTGLTVNIWIDETEAYKNGKHAKRIKFQINRKQKFQPSNTCPMTLDGKIPEKVWEKVKRNKEFSLTSDDKNSVENFVVNNSYALDKVADQFLWLDDFWDIFIKGGEKATDDKIEELKKKTDEYVQKHKDEE